MKKVINTPHNWKHEIVEAELSALGVPLRINCLSLSSSKTCSLNIKVLIMPNNVISYIIEINGKWHHFSDFGALMYHGFDIETHDAIFYALLKLWQCLTPSKTKLIIEYYELYQQVLLEADKELEPEIYFDKMLYVTNHLFKKIKRLIRKESLDWSVTAKPIEYHSNPHGRLLKLNEIDE